MNPIWLNHGVNRGRDALCTLSLCIHTYTARGNLLLRGLSELSGQANNISQGFFKPGHFGKLVSKKIDLGGAIYQ